MVSIRYVSKNGEEFNFSHYDTRIVKAGFHEYEWDYDGTEVQYGVKLNQFNREPMQYTFTVVFRGENKRADLNRLCDLTDTDIANKTAGRLYWNDWYLEGFITAAQTTPSKDFFGAERTMTFTAMYPFWLKEDLQRFNPYARDLSSGLDYEYDYNYDFTADSGGARSWNVQGYGSCNFVAEIFGYVENPQFFINNHCYKVFDTINEHEILQIDSKELTVVKLLPDGSVINDFDLRNKEVSVFEKIPSGLNTVTWDGSFGFNITALFERSEPRW